MKALLFFFLISPALLMSQQLSVMSDLCDELSESSALAYINGKIISINDSGGAPTLYVVDSLSGSITGTMTISNATNIDWESICYDSDYIYVGDFGNNNGSRTNLTIYRIAMPDIQSGNENLIADTIYFKYADQTQFTPSTYATNYDAEASLVIGDSIFVFTKNWGDNRCNIYAFPKFPGQYICSKMDSLDVQGLVTGATINPSNEHIMLTGYTATSSAFIAELKYENVVGGTRDFHLLNRYDLSVPDMYSRQIEGICAISGHHFILSSEKSFTGASGLYKMDFSPTSGITENSAEKMRIYPNPSASNVTIELSKGSELIVFDASGRKFFEKVLSDDAPLHLDISNWQPGVYSILVTGHGVTVTEKLVVK